ncbi:outer membrane autotransporter protein [Zalerion maritima]|uniref:Outer membrane autotransporter protein n=1 Tax=Zalerion maritima TaxID=339359 RepID=A0AAD5RS42_9PEZI|nr:outer membrane autotransporter protein [Zalerion maritima]
MLFASTLLLATASLASLAQSASVESRGKGKGKGHSSGGPCAAPSSYASVSKCNGEKYTYQRLAGYGWVAAAAQDKYNDTMSIGSSIAISDWQKGDDGYTAVFWGLPDRGWNTKGTLNYQPRVHKFAITFTPVEDATADNPSDPNLEFEYLDTILLTDPEGNPTTALDPDITGGMEIDGFPLLPAATYPGDGFGGDGAGGFRVSLDPEGIFLADDGGFWISDEYGPGIYQFNSGGKMIDSIRTVEALIPYRNESESFSSGNAPIYDEERVYSPEDPDHGRNNNQGFEGLTVSPDGKTLYVLLQSAAMQEGGSKSSKRRHVRFLIYDLERRNKGGLKAEYVVELPTYVNGEGDSKVASQSEIHFVSETQFMILPRDSNAGRALEYNESKIRHVDIFDISDATNILGLYDDATDSIETETVGELRSDITPALNCPFVDFNNNTELARFGLHNGSPDNDGLLNEKWEGLALLPVNSDGGVVKDKENEYYLFAASDNDFITDDGYMDFGRLPFSEGLGIEVRQQVLVFKVKLPKGSKPLIG